VDLIYFVAVYVGTFTLLGILFTFIERLHPARLISYRKVIWLDIRAIFLVTIIYLFAVLISILIPLRIRVPVPVANLPLAVRVLLFLLLADFMLYWIHRFMHKFTWHHHKWHHATVHLYWLSGMRANAGQQILFNLPYVVASPLLFGASPAVYFGVLLFVSVIQNFWIHMNVSWRSHRLETMVVTPRYHHLHHSHEPRYYNANFGALFTFWDRLFGTYQNPSVIGALTLGAVDN
jgi:sterol desaturase/sphingolipid hydroxylase (fatty acid hydroxylase superfamily)